jgi:ribokinase
MTDTQPRICVIGSSMTDQVVRAPRLPLPGETMIGSGYSVGFGGKGANQAVMAARLGGQVSLVAKLGRDELGQSSLRNFAQQNIATEFVFLDEALPSGVAQIWVDENTGQNSIIVVSGANCSLTPGEVRSAQAAIGSVSVVVCQNEIPMECSLEAFRVAKASGATTILNPAPAAAMPTELLELTDILVPNESEAALLTSLNTNTEEGAAQAGRALREMGVAQVVVTLSERGALLVDESGAHHVDTRPARAIDSTGAGDAFVGSLAFFLASGLPMERSIKKACRVATRSVLKPGAQSSYPYAQDIPEIFAL